VFDDICHGSSRTERQEESEAESEIVSSDRDMDVCMRESSSMDATVCAFIFSARDGEFIGDDKDDRGEFARSSASVFGVTAGVSITPNA
jgi:hypothetical protein